MINYTTTLSHSLQDVAVTFKDGRKLNGVILDIFQSDARQLKWLFLTNHAAIEYARTKDPELIQYISKMDVHCIDPYLK